MSGDLNTISSERLVNLRDKIENFEKAQQLQILRILKKNKININENKNGIFLNLTNIDNNIIEELEQFIKHIDNQEKLLEYNENVKNDYKQIFFKDNKDNVIISNNGGEI